MKTPFKFFFLLIIGTALFSSVVYGLAETMVEKHITACSFGLMVIVVTSLAGMMRSLALVPATRKVRTNAA